MSDVTSETGRAGGRLLTRFGALFLLGLTGVAALVLTADPSLYGEAAAELGVSVEVLALAAGIQSAVLLAVAVGVGLVLAPRLGFQSYVIDRVGGGSPVLPEVRSELPHALGLGLAVGAMLLLAELLAPTPASARPTATLGLLVESLPVRLLYGGITEELLLRWGVMSLVAFLLWKLLGRGTERPSARIAWIAIVVSAILFGVAHLPTAASIYGGLTADVVAFVVAGNAIGGVAFGWLFWKDSLEAAIVAHAFAHVVAVAVSAIVLVV